MTPQDFRHQAIGFLDDEERSEYKLIARMKQVSYDFFHSPQTKPLEDNPPNSFSLEGIQPTGDEGKDKTGDISLSKRLIEGYKQMSIKHIQEHFGTDPTMIPERKDNLDGCWDGGE